MKKLVFSVLALLSTSVFAQYISGPVGQIDGDTGNLVYTTVNPPPPGVDPYTWGGFTNTSSTGGGYSGGSTPAYNPTTGVFMFGYNRGTISYSTPLNYALASVGSNVNVNGFKYSWDYINQDYSRGTLTGNINVTNKSGQIVENRNYNMPATTNGWTHMSGIENFAIHYDATTLDRLNVSFSGKDDRWWAGYYGPQIKNISVSMLYSVLPPPVQTDFPNWLQLSNENGDFTLNKPGVVRYGANGVYVYHNFDAGTYSCSNSAWGVDPIGGVYKSCSLGTNTTTTPTTTIPKVTTTDTYTSGVALLDPTTTSTNTDPVTTTTTSITPTTSGTSSDTASSTPSTSTAPQQQQSVVTAVVSAPAPVTTTSSTSTTTTSSSSSTSSSSQSSKEVSSSGSPSLALSIISKNSERDAAGSAVAQAAVAQAQQAAAQAQQEAASVAQTAVSNSVASSQSSVRNESNSASNRSSNGSSNGFEYSTQSAAQLNAIIGTMQSSTSTSQTISDTQSLLSIAMLSPIATQTQQNMQTFATIQSNTTVQNVEQKAQTIQSEQYTALAPNPLTDKTNPLNDIIEGKQAVPQSNTMAPIGMSVNKNTSDNELAGGISISKMAYAPVGYGDYLNFVMKDASFYAPKEVYKNQRNVDNARALRQMTNDSKHREMVEAQYLK